MTGLDVVGTRLGRQSNSVKLSTLMQYQRDPTAAARPLRLSESSVGDAQHDGKDHRGDGFGDDRSGGDRTSPAATRSNSDAASLCGPWREARRRRSDTDTNVGSRLRDDSSSYAARGALEDGPPPQVLVDGARHSLVSPYDVTDRTTPITRSVAPRTTDGCAMDACSPSQTYHHHHQQCMSSAAARGGAAEDQQMPSLCVRSDWVDVRSVDMTVSFMCSPYSSVK